MSDLFCNRSDSRPVVAGPEQEAMDAAGATGKRSLRADATTADATRGPVSNSLATTTEARFTAACLLEWANGRMDAICFEMLLDPRFVPNVEDIKDFDFIAKHAAAIGSLLTRIKDREAAAVGRSNRGETKLPCERTVASRNHLGGDVA